MLFRGLLLGNQSFLGNRSGKRRRDEGVIKRLSAISDKAEIL